MSTTVTPHPKVTTIASKVTPDFAQRVREVAQQEDRTVSALIHRALRHYIAQREADRD